MMNSPIMYISCGDPLSVNFEILFKTLKNHSEKKIIIVGSFKLWEDQHQKLGVNPQLSPALISEDFIPKDTGVYFIDLFSGESSILQFIHEPLSPNTQKRCGEIAMISLEKAAELSYKNQASLVTLPVNKYHCSLVQEDFKGQTDWLAERFDQKTIMILKNPELTVALCTNHISIREVPSAIKKETIRSKAMLLNSYLKSIGILHPKIGVCGLNPHCGDQGVIGDEDHDIQSWIHEINLAEDIQLLGPIAADTLFQRSFREKLDGVLAMYHDQGLIPVKALSEEKRCVNITWGLDFLRISPDHGPAADLYLKGVAHSGSLEYAFENISQGFQSTSQNIHQQSENTPRHLASSVMENS